MNDWGTVLESQAFHVEEKAKQIQESSDSRTYINAGLVTEERLNSAAEAKKAIQVAVFI